MNFQKFSEQVAKQYSKLTAGELFYVEMERDELFDLYLKSFPEGTNLIYKERAEYDCTCCKNFIRNTGHVVSFVNGELATIWDIKIDEPAYQVVADALSAHVKTKTIAGLFRSDVVKLGNATTHTLIDGHSHSWNHFYFDLPKKFVVAKAELGELKGTNTANFEVLQRGVLEITKESCDIVKELIAQNSLYRGQEFSKTVDLALTCIVEYSKANNKEHYLWQKSSLLGEAGRFKNTVIGTLLVDLTSGIDLEEAVKSFESKVAPQNYKRPTSLITQGMIDKAQEKVKDLGLEDALYRRFAVTEDLTINNVLFADRSSKKLMGSAFDELSSKVKDKAPNLDKVQEVPIKEFIENILPKAESLELMLENKHTANLVSLIAPEYSAAGNILKWDNNFSWSYVGEVADSMKERVKQAGGNVDGVLRFSIQWNDGEENLSDLDAHCIQPDGNRIYFASPRYHSSTGTLDVDIRNPDKGKAAVENIVFTDTRKMPKGIYKFIVNCYNKRQGNGFSAEVEFSGKVFNFSSDKILKSGDNVEVAQVSYDPIRGFEMLTKLDSTTQSKEVWGVSTNKWNKVSMVMNSPNYWDGQTKGNQHYFFMLDGCKNPDSSRGFYNEFLRTELEPHRKVFETLGSKLKAKHSDNQLSGVGFSSTVSNYVLCKVSGSFNRVVKIIF